MMLASKYCGLVKPLVSISFCIFTTIPFNLPVFTAVVSHIIIEIHFHASKSFSNFLKASKVSFDFPLSHLTIPKLIFLFPF